MAGNGGADRRGQVKRPWPVALHEDLPVLKDETSQRLLR